MTGRAVAWYLGGRRTEAEMRAMINEARAMIGRDPVGGGAG